MCRAPGSFSGNTGDVGKAQRTGFSRAGSTESLGYRESRVSEGNKGRETEELISRCCCLLVLIRVSGFVTGKEVRPVSPVHRSRRQAERVKVISQD